MYKTLLVLLCAALLPALAFVVAAYVHPSRYADAMLSTWVGTACCILGIAAFQARDSRSRTVVRLVWIFFVMLWTLMIELGRYDTHYPIFIRPGASALKDVLTFEWSFMCYHALFWLLIITVLTHWLLRLNIFYFFIKALPLMIIGVCLGYYYYYIVCEDHHQDTYSYHYMLFALLYASILYEIDPQKNLLIKRIKQYFL